MNYTPFIINYLGTKQDITELYLAPKAFIMEKRGGKLIKASNTLLSPEDIRDTLVSLRSHTPFATGPLGKEGVFSFGLQEIGRLRVSYVTQRGSYVVHILKTPFNIPPLDKLCSDKESISKLDEIVRLYSSGLVIFQCKNYDITSTFVYSFLQSLCKGYSKVILILEAPLSFLLKHDKSFVIQREIGTDVETFEEGIRSAFYLNPDIVYLGLNLKEGLLLKEIDYMVRLIESETLVLLSLPLIEKELLRSFERYLKAWVSLDMDEKGLFTLSFKHIEPQALESR
ncbi:MAG: twitching motility protein [Aquificaceae bacterium]